MTKQGSSFCWHGCKLTDTVEKYLWKLPNSYFTRTLCRWWTIRFVSRFFRLRWCRESVVLCRLPHRTSSSTAYLPWFRHLRLFVSAWTKINVHRKSWLLVPTQWVLPSFQKWKNEGDYWTDMRQQVKLIDESGTWICGNIFRDSHNFYSRDEVIGNFRSFLLFLLRKK